MIYRKQATFTSSGTFTLPSTALPSVDYDLCGGGGSGGRHCAGSSSAGTGGGGGERLQGATTLVPGDSYSVVIGAGGAGINADGNGNDGGASSAFGLTARGGKAGLGKFAPADGGASGAGVAAPFATMANSNQNYSGSPVVYSSAPGASVLNAGGTSAVAYPPAGIGYDGKCSGGGSAGNSSSKSAGGPGAGGGFAGNTSSAGDATAPGCGGGGLAHASSVTTLRYSGSGFRGQLDIIYWDTVP